MSKLYILPLAMLFCLFLIPNVNAQNQIWYDDFTRDVFTPWVNYGTGMGISAINGYVTMDGISNNGGMIRNITFLLSDFDYFSEIRISDGALFWYYINFKDNTGSTLQFSISTDTPTLPNFRLIINYNGTQYNSSLTPSNYSEWKKVSIKRVGNFVNFTYNTQSLIYNLPIQYPVTSIDHHLILNSDSSIRTDNSNLNGFISIPSKNYTWSQDTTCFTDGLPTGSAGSCSPENILVDSRCIAGSVSAWIKTEILGYPLETCGGTVRLKGYVPAINLTVDQNYTDCIDKTTLYGYYYGYSGGDLASGIAYGSASQLCECWSIFTVYGRLHIECQWALNQKAVDFGNGTSAMVYCDNGVTSRWCKENYYTYLDFNCSEVSIYCTYGCDIPSGSCTYFNETTGYNQPTSITGFLNTGSNLLLSPVVIWTIILFVIAFISETALAKGGVKTGGKVIAGVVVVGITIFALFGIYPRWLLVVEIVIVALVIGLFVKKKGE